MLGVYIHALLDVNRKQSAKGRNPFDDFSFGDKKFSSVVKSYDPPYAASSYVYAYIKNNLASWVEEAIRIRNQY